MRTILAAIVAALLLAPAATATTLDDIEDDVSNATAAVIGWNCSLADRNCYPTDEQYTFRCNIYWAPPPMGGIVGQTYGYAVVQSMIACNMAGDFTGFTAETAGDAGYYAATQGIATVRFVDDNVNVDFQPYEDFAAMLVQYTASEAVDQFAYACMFLVGSNPVCWVSGPAGAPNAGCVAGGGGGVVGDVRNYVAAAANSGCGYAFAVADEAIDLLTWGGPQPVIPLAPFVDDRVKDAGAYVKGQTNQVGDQVDDAEYYGGLMADNTCYYLVGTTCPV